MSLHQENTPQKASSLPWKSLAAYIITLLLIGGIYERKINPSLQADAANIVFIIIAVVLSMLICVGLSQLKKTINSQHDTLDTYLSQSSYTKHPSTDHNPIDDPLDEIPPFYRILLEHGPAFFAALGIVFTFFGLITSISKIDPNDLNALNSNINGLLAGVRVAFFSSLAGVTLSFVTLGITRYQMAEGEKVTEKIHAELDRLEQDNTPQAILLRLETQLQTLPNAFAKALSLQLESPLDQITESLKDVSHNMHNAQKDLLNDLTNTFLTDFSESLNKPFQQLETTLAKTTQWQESTFELYEKTFKNLENHVTAHQQQLANEAQHFDDIQRLERDRLAVYQEQFTYSEQLLENKKAILEVIQQHTKQNQSIVDSTTTITTNFDLVSNNLSSASDHLQKVEGNLHKAITEAREFATQLEQTFTTGIRQSTALSEQRLELLRVEGERTQSMQILLEQNKESMAVMSQHFDKTNQIVANTDDIATRLNDASQSLTSAATSIQKVDHQLTGTTQTIATNFEKVSDKLASSADHLQHVETQLHQATDQATTFAKQLEQAFQIANEHAQAHDQHRIDLLRTEAERTQSIQSLVDQNKESTAAIAQHIHNTKQLVDATATIATSINDASHSLKSASGTIHNLDIQLVEALETTNKTATDNLNQIKTLAGEFTTVLSTAIHASENQSQQGIENITTQLNFFADKLKEMPEEFAKMVKRVREKQEDDMLETFKAFEGGASNVVESLGGSYTQIQATLDDMTTTTEKMSQSFQDLNIQMTNLIQALPKPQNQKSTQPLPTS